MDACILLSIFDAAEETTYECEESIKILYSNGWKLYVSTHIHSEVINRLSHILFEDDVVCVCLKQETFNQYIDLLVDEFFTVNEKISIIDWVNDPDNNNDCPVNLRRKWAGIYKSEYSDYLMPYVSEVNDMFDSLKIIYNISFVSCGEAEYYVAVKNMIGKKLLSQDAYHLATCITNEIPCILTMDRDFVSTSEIKVIKPIPSDLTQSFGS